MEHMQCPRCNGFIIIPTYAVDDDDPTCSSCSRSYPHLKPDPPQGINSNGAKPKRGLRETLRYTGSIKSLKTATCIVNYKAHPSPSVSYPLLEVSCPWCGAIIEVKDGYTYPKASRRTGRTYEYSWRNLIEEPQLHTGIGRARVKCPTGHLFTLKITNEGVCSWE